VIRKAILGLVLCAAIVLGVWLMLGFSVADIGNMFRKPYLEALEDGDYLSSMAVSVDGDTVKGDCSFEMEVRNPTPRTLRLVGAWTQAPELYTIDPAGVDVNVPPGETRTTSVRVQVVPEEGVPVARFAPPVLRGKWMWEKWTSEEAPPEQVQLDVEVPLVVRRSFGAVNFAVLGGYLILVLLIGVLAGTRIKGTRSFFIADGKMNYVVVGLSILGTYLSALGMMGLTGAAFGVHDWTYTIQLPCLVITAIVITSLVLPRYRAAGIVSIYEYLEQRIDVSARLAASGCFLLFAVCRMGLLLYLPGLAMSTITGMPLWMCILSMGVIITIYTAVGGIEAVVWTDVVQVIIFVVGSFLALGYIFREMDVSQFVDIGRQYNKFRVIVPGFSVTKITTAWLVLETIYQTIRLYGTSQDLAQRYMATDSTEHANRSLWIGILGYIPLAFLFFFIGTALFAYYQVHPDVNLPAKADRVFPYFVANKLPAGLAGLVIAAIFAAAMSSIDSLMNSSSTVCVEDFLKRFAKVERTDEQYLKRARFLTLLWGTLAIVMGLLCMRIEYAQIMWGKLMGISTNGILALMALAFLPFKVNKWAAMAAFAFSYVCLFVMMGAGINFLLWPVIGNTVCFLLALFLHPLFSRGEPAGESG